MTDIQFHCPHCRQAIEATFDMLGQLMDCPACGQTVEVQKSPVKLPLAPGVPPLPPKKPSRLREYKVLTQRDKAFGGEFTPEKLEPAINAYAAQGWLVVSVTPIHFPAGPGATREEVIVVMGRDK